MSRVLRVASPGYQRDMWEQDCMSRSAKSLRGAEVFSYDQRISNSLWDHHTVLCRGLVVMMPLPEDLKDLEDAGKPL